LNTLAKPSHNSHVPARRLIGSLIVPAILPFAPVFRSSKLGRAVLEASDHGRKFPPENNLR
jgi:hypothetical protein